ncbi:MAG TPA: energy transducer TonB [Pyrinomonadaceae bacterium]|jgi:protein TonB
MFTNLIESQSHRKEFKRRSSFVLVTVAAYAVILFGAGVASIYAYDANLEAQTSGLELLSWVPAVTPEPIHEGPQPVRRPAAANNNSRASSQPARPILYESASNPLKAPDHVSAAPNPIPPAPPNTRLGNFVSDPIAPPSSSQCVTCTGSDQLVRVETGTTSPPPPPPVVKPPTTERVTSKVLSSKALNLPQPAYPMIAKQARIQGPVNIQILVDEQGKVISAQIVSGSPMLTSAAKEAAMRARFTPTILNGHPVKIQGVIIYNFVLQ